jgi:prepilin-type N-terminal cleavage/methylation domain-containing protein
MFIRNYDQRGDTIIEVLVCLVILGSVMGVTYKIAVRAQQSIRNAQERVEALKLAEGQLEQLKALKTSNNSNFADYAARTITTPQFCFDKNSPNSPLPVDKNNPFATPSNDWNVDVSLDKFSSYPPGCRDVDPSGGTSGLYNVSITPPGNATGGVFIVRIRWDRLGGGERQEVKVEYKLYAN